MVTRYVQGTLTWIDIVAPTPGELRQVMQEYSLDPRVVEDLSSPSPKSKVEQYGDLLYLVFHFPALRAVHARPDQEIDFCIGKNFLITCRYETIDPLHFFARAFEAQSVLGRGGSTHGGHLFVTMARDLYRSLSGECEGLYHRLDDIEDKIFAGGEREMVAEISRVGRMVHDFRRILMPHAEMLRSLEPAGEKLFGISFAYHVRGVIGEYERIRNSLEHLREWLGEMRETNNSLLSTKQNEIMKILTILAFVTFPLTLISSIFGMNTSYLPVVGMPGDFWIVTGGMTLLAASFFVFFKHKRWL